MNNGKLSERSKKQIEILFMDDTIRRYLIDDDKKELYKTVTINDDGSITFGKTRVLWWNKLIGDEKTISFADFALKTVAALSGQHRNVNDIVLKGLGQEVIKNAIMDNQYDLVVDRLFDAARYGVQSSLNTKGFSIDDKIDRHVKIDCKEGIRKVRLPGSGDVLCKVKIGVTGVDCDVQEVQRLCVEVDTPKAKNIHSNL